MGEQMLLEVPKLGYLGEARFDALGPYRRNLNLMRLGEVSQNSWEEKIPIMVFSGIIGFVFGMAYGRKTARAKVYDITQKGLESRGRRRK